MKKSDLQSIEDFRKWLRLLGYHKQGVQYYPVRIAEWMKWCSDGVRDEQSIRDFFVYLSQRPNQHTGGALGLASLRNYQTCFNLYSRYLLQSRGQILEVNVHFKNEGIAKRKVLTKGQIEKLYAHTGDDPYGLRDRALLALYYGCGLRKSEGAALKVSDIRLDSRLVYVQRGKNYRSRLVPIAQGVYKDLSNYLYIGRPMLLRRGRHEHFFVGRSGRGLSKSGLYESFRRLCKRADLGEEVGLHSLRHSIATHLLENGVPLKQIARFLGHRSIESTQIYTHLVELKKKNNQKANV